MNTKVVQYGLVAISTEIIKEQKRYAQGDMEYELERPQVAQNNKKKTLAHGE